MTWARVADGERVERRSAFGGVFTRRNPQDLVEEERGRARARESAG